MPRKVGPIVINRDSAISGEIRKRVEEEILALLQEAMDRATEILKKHEKAHVRLANALLERETLTAEEMHAVIDNKPLPPLVES
jgi:ATP-dependent Zn protease